MSVTNVTVLGTWHAIVLAIAATPEQRRHVAGNVRYITLELLIVVPSAESTGMEQARRNGNVRLWTSHMMMMMIVV